MFRGEVGGARSAGGKVEEAGTVSTVVAASLACNCYSDSFEEYLSRVRSILPHWPEDVVRSWLFENGGTTDYDFLDLKTLRFRLEAWTLERIPGLEATWRAWSEPPLDVCEYFDFHCQNPDNWLAHYMKAHGTWSTAVVLFDNPRDAYAFPDGERLKTPIHLLEGHRRLTYLQCLRMRGQAAPTHNVWLVSKS